MKKNIYYKPQVEIIVTDSEPFLAASPKTEKEDGHVGAASGSGSNSSTGESWINLAKDCDSWTGDDLSRSSGTLWND